MEKKSGLQLLRMPFPENQISTLCKPYSKDSPKGKCNKCGGFHGLPALALSYVGHAALTDRLLDVDPEWDWEPLSLGPDGLPLIDKNGGMWIRLKILGVSRLGYGDAQGKSGPNATKELIGDALRNAAMRFGAALDLWHKGDLHADEEEPEKEAVVTNTMPDAELKKYKDAIKAAKTMEHLKASYTNAYRAASSISDTVAQDIFTDAKDERKDEISVESALPDADSTDGGES